MNWFGGNNALSHAENDLTVIKGTSLQLKKVAENEIPYVQSHADSIVLRINHIFELLQKDEANIKKVFDAAESGKLDEEMLEELLSAKEGYAGIKHKRIELIGAINGLINMCNLAITADNSMSDILKELKLENYEHNELVIFNKAEKDILDSAKSLLSNMDGVFSYVEEVMSLDVDAFRADPKGKTLKLRKKASSMYVKVLKSKEDTKRISDVLANAVTVLETIRRKNILLERSLTSVISELKNAPSFSNGKDNTKVNRITELLVSEIKKNGGMN